MKYLLSIMSLFFLISMVNAQRWMEGLNRGLVAVRTSTSSVFLSWRLLGTESDTVAFNIYRNSIKVNPYPISATNFLDQVAGNATYTVKAIITNKEEENALKVPVWDKQYLQVPIQPPADGTSPDGIVYSYSANDASVGDLDGDGEYEIVVKWEPSNAKDNSQSGYTGNVFIDAYKLTGKKLWRIDLGKNIRAGAHYTQFLVYDFDCDGQAEMACKTADGTRDGIGKKIGDSTADFRLSNGYILSGTEYLTIFKGSTGEALDTKPYGPPRGLVSSWGDNYGNRVDRFTAVVAYLDGVRPSMVFGRGYYTRMVRVAWDFKNGTLQQRWIFDSNNGYTFYEGMGNHQMMVADVNGDGKDEIYNGSSAINYDGTGLYSNGFGHGDALHITDMDPSIPGLELWQCLEEDSKYAGKGLRMNHSATGLPMWGVNSSGDIGRALAADIDPRYKGYECWGGTGNLYNCKGNQIAISRPSMNHAVWWDGDLLRELLDGDVLDKWNYTTSSATRLLSFYQADLGSGVSNNSTKKNPCLTADILGDWREEIILRSVDNKFLNIYTTTIPTVYKFYTLMHDPQYRLAIAWQNCVYNQPPHPGFYLGDSMQPPPRPNIQLTNIRPIIVDTTASNVVHVSIYPNPSTTSFTIKYTPSFQFYVYDFLGRRLVQGTGNGQVVVPTNHWPAGLYVIKIVENNNVTIKKLIKQ